jgi:hypothetical protein
MPFDARPSCQACAQARRFGEQTVAGEVRRCDMPERVADAIQEISRPNRDDQQEKPQI